MSVHDTGRRQCGIVTFSITDRPAGEIVASLEALGANTHVAGLQDSRLDFEHRGLPDLVRASVHYYNTEGEIERFGELVSAIAKDQSG